MIRWLLIYLFVCNNYIKQKHSVKIQKLHQLSQSGSSMQIGGVENWEEGACICIFIHCIYDVYKIECNKNHLRWVPFRMYSCFIPSIPETNSGSDQDKLLTEDEWINEWMNNFNASHPINRWLCFESCHNGSSFSSSSFSSSSSSLALRSLSRFPPENLSLSVID